MLFLCVNVYCHRVTTQLQLINIIIIIKHIGVCVCLYVRVRLLRTSSTKVYVPVHTSS